MFAICLMNCGSIASSFNANVSERLIQFCPATLIISDNASFDEKEPGIVFTGITHASEWPSLSICISIAENLTSKYESDPDVRYVVDNRRIWIVPCLNPDGYYYCHDLHNNGWRKNLRDNNNNGKIDSSDGVDLNRNFEGSYNGDMLNAWGSQDGDISHDPSDIQYCGPGPCSEKETKAIQNLFIQENISANINWHTGKMDVLYWPHNNYNPYNTFVGE